MDDAMPVSGCLWSAEISIPLLSEAGGEDLEMQPTAFAGS